MKNLSALLRGSNYGTLPVANGGTGLTSPGTAGYILTSTGTTWVSQPAPISLPTQTSNLGKYLTTDGTTASWTTIPKTVSVLTRNGTTLSNIAVTINYVAVLSRSNISIQVSIT
jgi:hypothetical protein